MNRPLAASTEIFCCPANTSGFNNICSVPAIALYIFIFISLVLAVVCIYLMVSRSRLLHKITSCEEQLTLSRINPHFIFNSLSAIQSYIFRNDPLQAGKYLSSFAKLIRLILENSKQSQITVDNEIRTIRLYLELQSLRFEGTLNLNLEIDNSIDTQKTLIPPLLTFPFLENYIEHGLVQLSNIAILNIRFLKEGNKLIIEITNEGTGIDKAKLNQINSNQSYLKRTIESANERIKKIGKSNRNKIELEHIALSSIDKETYSSSIKLSIQINN